MNMPVCWRLKSQIGMTLSRSGAEFIAIWEVVKEFIYSLLRKIGIEIDLQITMKTDKISALFMAQNASSGVRACNIDTRHHYTRENFEEN
jgi:hypothetical protein